MNSVITPIINRKIRLGFVGCSRIAETHFTALEQHCDDIEVVAVCDMAKAKAEQAAQRMQTKAYTELTKMLGHKNLDIVTIATPNGLHARHAMEVANRKVHVIIEKPMAIKLSDGLKMLEYCNNKNVALFVIYQNRFNRTVQEVWKAYQAGRFGKIYMITANVFWMRPQKYYDHPQSWHGKKDMEGGAFYTQASHYLDLMQWLAGAKPKMVYANLKTLAHQIETEDTGIAQIEWENGILGAINTTVLTFRDNLEGSITILGEKGTVKLGGTSMNLVQHWEFADSRVRDREIIQINDETTSVYGLGHTGYYQNIINVFRGKEKPLIDGKEGLKSLELLEGIYRSNDEKRPVHIHDSIY